MRKYDGTSTNLQAGVPAVGHTTGENSSRGVLDGVETFQRAPRVHDERLTHLHSDNRYEYDIWVSFLVLDRSDFTTLVVPTQRAPPPTRNIAE